MEVEIFICDANIKPKTIHNSINLFTLFNL